MTSRFFLLAVCLLSNFATNAGECPSDHSTEAIKTMIVLNPLFQNGVVLQRNMEIPVWGQASAGAFLEVSIAGKKSFTRASASGKFMAHLPALPAGGPYELIVTDHSDGKKLTLSNVLIGEVWLASGQSNMEYPLGADWRPRKTKDEVPPLGRIQEKEFYHAVGAISQIRFFSVKKCSGPIVQETAEGTWHDLKPPYASEASAAAAWFALQLRKELKVPVGVIISAHGGTRVEAWTSRAGLLTDPLSADLVHELDRELNCEQVWKDTQCPDQPLPCAVADSGNKGIKNGWANREYDDSDWKEMTVPGSWMTQKICGNGAVWFRKSVELPDLPPETELFLEIPGIDKQDISYFNGVEIGRTGSGLDCSYWNVPRRYRIPGKLLKKGKNVIAVRAYSFISNGGFFGEASKHRLISADETIKIDLAGKWRAEKELDLGMIPSLSNCYPLHPLNPNTPGNLFNTMLNPLIPFALRGVIWYQGENNANTPGEAMDYRKKLATMIRDWRYRWERKNLPFIQVQLADFDMANTDQPWAYLRESQRMVCHDLDEVYAVSAMDLGDALDIHPQNKKEVGLRLAAAALHHVYRRTELLPCGPLFSECRRENDKLKISFLHADGLTLKGDHPVSAFEIAGPDGIFHPAENAEIEDGVLILSASAVPFPVAARYAWRNLPANTLYNRAGYPASSFDTRNQK